MDALINKIHNHSRTPQHLRKFLLDHVDSDTKDGLALFDVLCFIHDLETTHPDVYEKMFGHDGRPFRSLADIVIQRLRATSDYSSLQALVWQLSQKLTPHKDEHGCVDVEGLTIAEAAYWVAFINQENNKFTRKELR